MAAGLTLIFLGTAPPVAAQPDSWPQGQSPYFVPREAVAEYRNLVPQIALQPEQPVFPVQEKVFLQWEKQVLQAHQDADNVLNEVDRIMGAASEDGLDRFTSWVWLARYSQDLKQADLMLHDTTPPQDLDLEHRQRLISGVSHLHASLGLKREAIHSLQQFLGSLDRRVLDTFQQLKTSSEDKMSQGLLEIAQVRADLGISQAIPIPQKP